jgi:hypothetical protein
MTFEGSSACIEMLQAVSPLVFARLSDRKRGNASDGNGSDRVKTQNYLVFRSHFLFEQKNPDKARRGPNFLAAATCATSAFG